MASIREYPPKPLKGNTTTITGASYGNGVYKASASSVWGEWSVWSAFNAYDDKKGEWQGGWHSESMSNAQNNGYNSPAWIQLQLPTAIQLKSYVIRSRYSGDGDYHKKDFPNKFKVKGSNNGTSWTVLDTRDNIAKTVSTEYEAKEFTVSKSKSYTYFRVEVENVGVDGLGRGKNADETWVENPHVAIAGLSFFGKEEKSGAIWNPLEDGFWSASNLAMWVYIGVAAVLVLILVMVLVM